MVPQHDHMLRIRMAGIGGAEGDAADAGVPKRGAPGCRPAALAGVATGVPA
jgi:hypothetical protein